MKAFFASLGSQIANFVHRLHLALIAMSRWPIIEPLLETLHYQRTIILIAGFAGMKLVPELWPALDLKWKLAVGFVVMLVSLIFFVGLQREVLEETKKAIDSLPATPEGYLKEFWQLYLDALRRKAEATEPVTAQG